VPELPTAVLQELAAIRARFAAAYRALA